MLVKLQSESWRKEFVKQTAPEYEIIDAGRWISLQYYKVLEFILRCVKRVCVISCCLLHVYVYGD
jgi:hypothetical protein